MLSDKFRAAQRSRWTTFGGDRQRDVSPSRSLETVGHNLGKAIAGLINIFNPELIVIGGSLSTARSTSCSPCGTPSTNTR